MCGFMGGGIVLPNLLLMPRGGSFGTFYVRMPGKRFLASPILLHMLHLPLPSVRGLLRLLQKLLLFEPIASLHSSQKIP